MRAKIIEMKQERAGLWEQAKALNEKVLGENRDFDAAETEQYDKVNAKMDSLAATIARTEKLADEGDKLNAFENDRQHRNDPNQPGQAALSPRETEAYNTAYARYLRAGQQALTDTDFRAMQADSDTAGGFVVTPMQFVTQMIKAVDDAVYMRQLATVHKLEKAVSLGVPTLDSDPSDADWTSEVDTGNETDIALGRRELNPHPVAKLIRVSNKLIRAAGINVENLVRDRLAYKFAVTQEKGFQTGTGAGQPLGVFTASVNGITTARDISAGNTTTTIQGDGLINAKYELKAQHMKNANWLFHRDAIKMIRKLKDGEGQYLWKVGLTDKPDTILEMPYFMSEYTPNTFTTGLYVGIIGDFSNYWIADALDMQIQRLVELYARTNQVGFIGRMESDGMPVLSEAFVRVKLA